MEREKGLQNKYADLQAQIKQLQAHLEQVQTHQETEVAQNEEVIQVATTSEPVEEAPAQEVAED
jgi:uncharacterized protein YlxW (UPF0749 family)